MILFFGSLLLRQGLSSMKNSYYLTDYIRREHEEISQCPYCSVFSIRCNLFQLSSRGETVCSTTERLLCEILDSSHEIRQDYAVRIIAGMEAFLTRVYQEDLNTAMTAQGGTAGILAVYTVSSASHYICPRWRAGE